MSLSAPAAGWLARCQAVADGIEQHLLAHPGRARRGARLGPGRGGDTTLAVDRAAEDVVVACLDGLETPAGGFLLVSEELGERRFGAPGSPWRVVVDPIDGSLNAKRGLPFFAVSIAVADGPRMRDVRFAFVHDFGAGEQWVAERGAGVRLDGEPLGDERPGAELELVGFEATTPALLASASCRLPASVERVRVLGSLALALCQLAAGRLDGVASLKPARAIDIAAAQLVAREAGLALDLPDAGAELLTAPLDLAARSRVVAALDAAGCRRLADLLPRAPTMRA